MLQIEDMDDVTGSVISDAVSDNREDGMNVIYREAIVLELFG